MNSCDNTVKNIDNPFFESNRVSAFKKVPKNPVTSESIVSVVEGTAKKVHMFVLNQDGVQNHTEIFINHLGKLRSDLLTAVLPSLSLKDLTFVVAKGQSVVVEEVIHRFHNNEEKFRAIGQGLSAEWQKGGDSQWWRSRVKETMEHFTLPMVRNATICFPSDILCLMIQTVWKDGQVMEALCAAKDLSSETQKLQILHAFEARIHENNSTTSHAKLELNILIATDKLLKYGETKEGILSFISLMQEDHLSSWLFRGGERDITEEDIDLYLSSVPEENSNQTKEISTNVHIFLKSQKLRDKIIRRIRKIYPTLAKQLSKFQFSLLDTVAASHPKLKNELQNLKEKSHYFEFEEKSDPYPTAIDLKAVTSPTNSSPQRHRALSIG